MMAFEIDRTSFSPEDAMVRAFPRTRKRACAAALVLLVVAGAPPVAAAAQTAGVEPLGIALEGWPYPFPVRFREFALEGQTVRQAYMDLKPMAAPNGRTALLLHGRNFPSSYWEGVIRALSGAGWRVIATDQIGFGKSGKPDLAYTFDMFAQNTAALLDGLGVREVDVIGHSLGGMLAVRFTRSYPERVRRLVLEAPVGLEDYRLTVPPVTDRFLCEREYGLTAASYRDFLLRTYSLSLPSEVVEPFVELRERLKGSGEYPRWVASFVRSYQMIHDQPVVHEYPLVRTPTLFIMGANDHNAPGRPYTTPELGRGMGQNADNARHIAATMPDAGVLVLDGVGHMPHLERPEQFDAAILEFLGRD